MCPSNYYLVVNPSGTDLPIVMVRGDLQSPLTMMPSETDIFVTTGEPFQYLINRDIIRTDKLCLHLYVVYLLLLLGKGLFDQDTLDALLHRILLCLKSAT